jgi:site-specific DNA-cytosine methylase
MAERPLYTLYKNLKAQNYDVPDDYNKFESALTRDGKGGADNRHAIYENLKAQNFDVPNTYERFYSALFEPRSKTSSRAKGGSVPMSAADRARFSAGAAAISASAQHTMNNAGRYNRLKQRKQKQQKDFGRVNLGTHQTPYGGDANNVVKDDFSYNPETGKAGAYVSSDNENVYSQPEAEQKQAVLDQQNNAYQEAVDIGEIPSVFDVRDKNGNYDLQENINKNGTYLTEEGARNQFDKKLAEAYARKKEIEALIAEDHRQHGNPLLSYGASIGASNGRTAEQSDYSNKLATSLALVKQQIGALEAVKQYPTSSWGEDALKALDNTAFTAKTWDFGLTDFATMGQMERIKTKMDNNLPLSGSDKMLLKSKLGADAAAALEDEKMGNIYRWTKIAGQSLPFMADFFLTGGYGGVTKAISRGALKIAAKRGMGKVSAAILKNTGIVAGDIIGSYAMAGSEQAMKTGADIMQRHLGSLYQDENGDYKFGTFDENGNLLHEGGESMGTALYKGLTSAMVENYTEKLFGHSYGIKKGAINFMEKHGMNASAEFFKNIGKSGWYTNSKKWMEKFGINGFGEEVMEEEIGIPLHALLDGDNKFSDLLDTKQQLDIIGGMALSVGSMYAMGAGSRPVKGVYNRAQYYRFRNKVNVADSDAQNLMGDNWADIKDKIDNATNEQMGGVLADILRQRDTMTKEQINAAVNYGVNLMKMRGYNIAKTAEMNAKEITNEPTTSEEQHQEDIDNAYSEGHDADDADKHDIQLEHEDQMKTLAGLLNISEQQLSAMNDDELQSLTGQNDKLDQAIYDYQLSSARYQGVTDDAQDKIDMAANQAAQRVDMYTDKSRGSVRNATVKASGGAEDYGVYIISGNIATHDDGSIDVSNSDDMILYYDPTTNSVEHADATMFAELGEELPADEVKAQAVADAKETAIKEVAGIIDGTVEVGSQFNVTDTDGTEHTYEVLADYGDGAAAISIDGNVVENPYSLADLQQMKDLEDKKRLETAKAEREQMEKERAAQQNQETEQTQPSFDFNQILNDNGNVVLADVIGNDGNTKYPNSQLFLIRDSGAKAKVVELKSDGTLVPHAVNKKDVRTATTMTLDEYKQAFAESSMIEDNSGEESDEDSQLANLGLPKGSEIWMSGDGFGRPKENTLSRVVGIDEQGSIILEDKDGKKWSASFDYINNHRELPPLDENNNIVNEENNQSESNAEENTPAPAAPAITLEDGTIVPMLEDGNPDFSKLTADQTAELYDSQFGEDADSVISGWVSDAKKALDKANNMTVKGKNFVEQKAAKEAKEKAIADAQAAYDSAIAIRDAYNSRQLAKVEDTAEGRKNIIEKARRKFSRLKSAVKDDAEAVSQLYKDVVGSLLHRLYDGTGIDVTDTIPLTAEEYVASNLGAHSLNYEGTETSKGVKQETGLSREDFAKTQLLAADGKGTTIDNLVHSLWENRPSNLESLDTQDIRNALIGVLNSGFRASEARNYIENLRIAQAENILEEQKKAADNAAFAEEQKAKQEEEEKKAEENAEEKAEEKTHSEAFNKIVDLAKKLEEILDNPDNVKEIDKITHEIDELMETLSDEEFKEVSDVLLNIDEDLEYLTADEYERREGVEESKKAKAYNESLQQAIKRIAPYADALKAAVKSGDKKAIAKAQKELTDALLASNLGHGYLSGQLEYAKSAKKKDESYSERRALVKPLTDAINAIESALDSALSEAGLEGVHVDFTEGGHGWIYADKGSAWSSRLKALDNDYRNVSQYETQNPISVLPQVTMDNVEKVAGIIKSRIEEGERYNSDEYNDEENEKINGQTNENINAPEQNKFHDKLREGSKAIEVPEDATEENPFGEQRPEEDLPFSAKENGKQQTTAERAADVEKNNVDDMKVVDNIVGQKTRKAFERLAKMMGASIQWQYSDKLGNGWIEEDKDADGNVHRTIFITLDSSITEGAQFIFGHEMTHQIKNLNPAAYNELTQLVLDTYGSDAFDKAIDETMKRYSDAGFSGRARDYYAEEVVADAVGEMIRDLNLAHTLAMKMSHPLLVAIHEILQKIKLAFFGTEYSDVTKNIIRSIEQAYVKTANREAVDAATQEGEVGKRLSLRTKPEPKKTQKVYKLMRLGEDGKLYPLFIGSGEAIELGKWYDADSPKLQDLTSLSSKDYVGTRTAKKDGASVKEEYHYGAYIVNNKTGEAMSLADFKAKYSKQFARMGNNPNKKAVDWATDNGYRWIKIEEKNQGQSRYGGEARSYYNYGINGSGSVSIFAMRPGWHAGSLPTMRQIGKGSAKNLRDDTFVWVEGEIPAEIDYNEEAQKNADKDIPDHIPTDGYYLKATNANKEASQADKVGWYVAGAFRANRIMSDKETRDIIDEWNATHPDDNVEYDWKRESGKDFNAKTMSLEDTPKFSLKVYHGSGADFTEFDFDHMGEGEGSQAFGWGGYVTSSKKIGKNYATLMDNDPSRAYYRIQHSNGIRFAKKYPTLESFLHGDKQIAMNDKFTEQEKIDYYNEMKKLAEPYHNLYEVDIPDDNGSNYLDWDAPLTDKQKNTIIKELRRLKIDFADFKKRGFSFDGSFGGNSYDFLMYALRKTKKWKDVNASRAVSKFLSSLGYTGIKYKAGRNFGGAEEGDTNYVIFKPEDMRITEHTKFSLRLKSAIEETETNPSDAQKESGNYKKGHIKFGGYDYTIENPKGSTRSGKDSYGKEWKVTMHDTYGYIRGKFGKDGDHLDMFINDKADLDNWNGDVFVVDQVNPDGSFDEHKVMYGYDSMDDAKKAYLANYSDGWQGLGNITGVSKDEFDKWLDTSKRKLKPFADYSKVKFSLNEIKPVGVGAFGNIYNQFRGKAKAAIEFLKKLGSGEATAALHHHTIGDISLVWGDKKTGLDKILRKHPEVVDNLQSIIDSMEVVQESDNRIKLESPTHFAVVSKEYKGEPREQWLLTAYEKRESLENGKSMDTATSSLGGDTALSQSKESAAKIDNSSETAKENGEKFSLKDEKIKSVAEKFGVNEDDVAMYANAVERGSTAEAARARANIKRYLLQANEDKISSFKDIIKYTKPINESLKENFGDLDAMIEERRKQVEAQRNAMEAARKRAQEEEEKRQKHLDELSLIPTDELDKRYMDAIANNDESTAREMLDESARRKGYDDADSDYQGQGAWAAPSNPQYESDEARRADIENSPDVNLEDIALGYNLQPDDYFDNPRAYMNNTAYGLESAHVIKNALDAIKNGEKDVKVKVYRAVPTSVKEGKLRNGDWVTPSKKYAEMHGDNRLDGKYRIIEDEVPANQLWWDGNDVNEFGFDDGKEYRYKNAKNNRKLNDLITYDNKGNVIPPSKRFNSRKSDIRFSLKEEKEKIVADAKANGTYMTAPNGEKTKLDAEQWATVRTANFKNWFGDWENDPENASKVVDENGEPMVVWHGRSAEFNTFEKKEGVRFIMGLEDKVKAEGFFFSPDKDLAEEFASNSSRHRGGKANVVPCFLNIRRPMDLTGEDYDRIYEDVTGWEYMVGMDTQDNLWGIMDEEGMADKIKEKGYDGAIFVEEVDDSYEPTKISYCALDANQIKSAENNNGDFSADNNDIRFSLKAMMEKPEGWKQANKKAIHIAEAIERDPKFSLKNLDGTLIKAGTYFSGGGLVEEGLKGIIDPVVAVEYDEKISGVYRNNFGQHIVTADVRDVDPKELVKQIDGEVEYFHASPVCKNYSQAKSNHAEVELDKETAASTAEFINAIKPKVVTIENVKGYKDSDAMKTITDALDANGYTWDADVYNAADYGGYTNRERLIVRAVRDGKLPEKPKKMARKSGWYEAVEDIIPTLTEKKNGVAPWMDIRLKADGIDWRNIEKPLYVMGSAYADGKVPHAFADELLPTLRTKSGDVIVMPDGKVYRAMGRVLARVSGVSDDYKMPFSENLSHTIIGNGIPTQLTEHVIAPLLTGSDPKFSIRTYHGTGASFDKFDLSHALEGEGSESFGHGVYVTNSREIGREYAQRAKSNKISKFLNNESNIPAKYRDDELIQDYKEIARGVFRGEKLEDLKENFIDQYDAEIHANNSMIKEFEEQGVRQDIYDMYLYSNGLKDSPDNKEMYTKELIESYKDEIDLYKKKQNAIRGMKSSDFTVLLGFRYDVNIPDDNGSNYLDWEGTIPDSLDKQKVAEDAYKVVSDNQGFNDFKATPLNDFIAHILKTYVNTTDVAGRVEKLKSDIKDVIENYVADDDVLALNEYLKDATPDDVLATIWYNDLVKDIKDADLGEELYRKLSTYVGDNAASQILSDNGLVGIKYPAGLIHGGAKEGDYNYVIFDENNANIVGNTRFSLRYDKFEHDLNQWKKDNNLPKDAKRPTIPQRNAGESAVDFLRRVDEYRKMMALWKTAPTYEQHLLSDDTALGEFNRELQRGSVLKRIAFQDSMLAIRKAQEAIMKEVGVDRLNMAEDAYTAENRSHGKGKNEFEEYNNEFLQPLRKAYHQMKKVLGDSYDNVRVYMMAKHGLERDAQMAFKKSLEADYEDVNQRSAAYKAYKNDLDRVSNDADLEFGRVDFTTWRQKDNALRGKYSPSYIDYRYDDNGIAYDYSGLSSLFDGSDFEEAAHKLVRDVETKHLAEVQALWNATNAATKKILRDGFKAGMMSKDAYEYVKGMYSHYIPLRGWDGTTADQVWDYIGGGNGAFNQTLKTAHGRTSIADDPIAYIENMAESGILLNNKNWVKQHLMLLAQNYPTSLLTLSKAWYVKSTDANGNEEWIPATPQITSQMNSNQVKAAIDAFEQKMEQMAQTGDATQQRDGLNIAYPQTHSEEREHEVRVMKDGEEYVIYVNGDPQLAQAMNNTRAHRVREIQSGKLDRAAAWLGRKMAAAYTSLSPLFIPSNYFRDLTMTLASTAIREDGRYNYLLRKNLATSWNLGFMLRDYQNGKLREKVSNGNATAKEQMFYDFMMNGGETGFVSSLDVEDLKKKFKNDLKDLDRWKANLVKVGHTIMDGIEFLNRAIEDSNRFAVYMTSIQYGRSIDEAVNDAKDVTLNFNRKGTGEYGWQMIRNLYLFINPAVQSLQTLGALAKHHPFKFTAVTASWLASGVLVPIVNVALMQLVAAFLGGDGDDDKDWYKDISKKYWQFSKWDRRNNFIMWVPTTHEFVKIPLAQEFRAFYGLGDMIASKMMGGELAEESWEDYGLDLVGQVVDMLPLDPTGYDGNIAVSLMPNAIRPVFELAFNVDFTGKPLFKDTEYNKYDPNFTKAYVGTPDWLVRASRMMNSIGNDYPNVQQNKWDALGNPRYNLNNPAVVDHVLSSYLGGAYTMGSQVLGLITKSLNDRKEIKVADIPLVSKFVSNPDDRPVSKKKGDEFWDKKEYYDRAANTISKLKKQAKIDGDYSLLERFYGSEEYKKYKLYEKDVNEYKEARKKERAEESGDEYRPHQLNAEDIYKNHATPMDEFEDMKLKQLFEKLNSFKTRYDAIVDNAPNESDGYYNTNKTAIDAIDNISFDKQEISELKKGFLDDGKDAYNAEDMKQIRELRKKILAVLEKANKVVVANQKAKADK